MSDELKNVDVKNWSNEVLAKFLEDDVAGSVAQCQSDRAVGDEEHQEYSREIDAVFEAAARLLRNVDEGE